LLTLDTCITNTKYKSLPSVKYFSKIQYFIDLLSAIQHWQSLRVQDSKQVISDVRRVNGSVAILKMGRVFACRTWWRWDNDAAQRDRRVTPEGISRSTTKTTSSSFFRPPNRTMIYEHVFRRGNLSVRFSTLPIGVLSPTRYRSSFYVYIHMYTMLCM